MDRTFATQLKDLNNRFYRSHAASFSDTRQAPWPGWIRAMATAQRQLDIEGIGRPVRVFDLACGNMRFENFMAGGSLGAEGAGSQGSAPDSTGAFEFYGVDSCRDLASDARGHALSIPNLHFIECDVLSVLMGLDLAKMPEPLFDAPPADLSVCFGFMHHVPGEELRQGVLRALVGATRPGGIVVVSFWQFMGDERLSRKAAALTERVRTGELCCGLDVSQLEENDYFLDWQSDAQTLRYCHHTTDAEIDRMLAAVSSDARELERYSADGRTGALNRYVILKRN